MSPLLPMSPERFMSPQEEQSREFEVGSSHFILAFQGCNSRTNERAAGGTDNKGLFLVRAANAVRSGHRAVPFLHKTPALKLLERQSDHLLNHVLQLASVGFGEKLLSESGKSCVRTCPKANARS